MDCIWNITSNGHIELVFIRLQTEDKVDIVTVYDGVSRSSPLIGTLFGNTLPKQSLTSTSNNLYVRFTSDISKEFAGFRARYRGRPGVRKGYDFPYSFFSLNYTIFFAVTKHFRRIDFKGDPSERLQRLIMWTMLLFPHNNLLFDQKVNHKFSLTHKPSFIREYFVDRKTRLL